MAVFITVSAGPRANRATPILAVGDPALVRAMLAALIAQLRAAVPD